MRLVKVIYFLFSNLMWSNDPRINDQYLRRSGQQRVISRNKASSTKMVLQLFVDDALFLAEFFSPFIWGGRMARPFLFFSQLSNIYFTFSKI